MTDVTTVAVVQKSKVVAGLLAIFFGQFGLHWMYLGSNKRGLTQILLFVLGLPLSSALMGHNGLFVGAAIMIGVRIWAFIDALRIFMGSIDDSNGQPLT